MNHNALVIYTHNMILCIAIYFSNIKIMIFFLAIQSFKKNHCGLKCSPLYIDEVKNTNTSVITLFRFTLTKRSLVNILNYLLNIYLDIIVACAKMSNVYK